MKILKNYKIQSVNKLRRKMWHCCLFDKLCWEGRKKFGMPLRFYWFGLKQKNNYWSIRVWPKGKEEKAVEKFMIASLKNGQYTKRSKK